MPEGDTVWNTARVLHRALAGSRLTSTDFRVPRLATADLSGATVLAAVSRGKHLLLRLRTVDDHALTLHSHLRMDGAWRVYAPGERWAARPAHLVRVVLRTADAVAVGYHLHDVTLVPTADENGLVGHLGPDLLGPDWDPGEAARRLAAHPATPIAEALLDQRNLAGIGNLYKCEVLFLRGVWPWTPVREVPELSRLVEVAHRLLAANRGRWVQSTTGSTRRAETTYVYGRRGEPCRRCGTAIRRDDRPARPERPRDEPVRPEPVRPEPAGRRGNANRDERVTYWCPTCQPTPATEAADLGTG